MATAMPRSGSETGQQSGRRRPNHVLVQLSDTHLTAPGVLYNGVIDADAALDRALEVVRDTCEHGIGVDLVIVSGDVTDTGDPDAYRRARSAVESVGRPVIWAPGNHDRRAPFYEHLLDRPGTADPVLQVHEHAGLRVVVLDSTVPDAGHGILEETQLGELASVLGTPAPQGTVLVLHHAPLEPPSPLLAHFALQPESRRALSRVIDGSDVRVVLAGHHHLAQSGVIAGVPVAVAGSVAIRTDPLAPPGRERTTRSASLNLVSLFTDTVTASVIPLDGAETVFDLDPDEVAAVIERTGAGPR